MSHTEKTKTAEKTNTTEAVGNFLVELDGKLPGSGGGTGPVAARAEVPPVMRRGENVTPAGLQASFAAIKEQVASAKAEDDGADFARVDGWVTAAEQALGQLDPQSSATPQEVEAAMGPRNSNFTAEQAARYDVGGQFLAIVRTLNNIRGKLNAPLQQRREVEEQRALEKAYEEEQRSRSAQKKGASAPSPKSTKSARASRGRTTTRTTRISRTRASIARRPSLPGGRLVAGTKGITALTAGKGNEALHFDRDGPTVRGIEADARANGLWVMSHSTLVHRFTTRSARTKVRRRAHPHRRRPRTPDRRDRQEQRQLRLRRGPRGRRPGGTLQDRPGSRPPRAEGDRRLSFGHRREAGRLSAEEAAARPGGRPEGRAERAVSASGDQDMAPA